MKIFAPINKDAYKIGHKDQYAPGTEVVYSNITARSGTHSNIPGSTGVVFIGMSYVCQSLLIESWNDTFFSQDIDVVVDKYQKYVSHVLGYVVSVEHMRELHKLGYLPVEIRALPEGSFVPYRVPMVTVKNTLPEFFWVTNMLETQLSAETWGMITSATTYNAYRLKFIEYAEKTGADVAGVPFQGHDFSMRGMSSCQSAATGSFAALAAGSLGTDTLPALQLAVDYYGASLDDELIAGSVNATEHSVMCSNSKDSEIGTFQRLMNETYPSGILSIVSDTWDFWKVVTEYLPELKDEILARDGKLVIRPDSGDPVDIICGYKVCYQKDMVADTMFHILEAEGYKAYEHGDGDIYEVGSAPGLWGSSPVPRAEQKGLVECLWDTFGGTINDAGYKVLNEKIGAIYGDSITLERQEQILSKLEEKGFCSSNIVLGIGSYTYQMVTRDTHGMAIKATYVEINGEGVEIFKDPKTDNGVKKSAKGLLQVVSYDDGRLLKLVDQATPAEANTGALKLIFKDGKMIETPTLQEVRDQVIKTCTGV